MSFTNRPYLIILEQYIILNVSLTDALILNSVMLETIIRHCYQHCSHA